MVAIAGAVFALLLAPASAYADPPALAPVAVNGSHPTLQWSLPAGVQSLFMEVATSPHTNEDGYLGGRANVSFNVLDKGQVTFTDHYAYPPGVYYAHVAGHDQRCVAGLCPLVEFSNLVAFEVGADSVPILLSADQRAGHISAEWRLPTGKKSDFIEAATSPATYATGDLKGAFLDDNLALIDEPSLDATSYLSPSPLPPRTYYVHVAVFDELACANPNSSSCVDEFTGILPVVVPEASSPAPLAPPPPPDRVTSFTALKCASAQKAGTLVVQASMPENGTITVAGTLSVPNAAKVYKLKAVSVGATAGKAVKIRVALPKKALKAAKMALKRHKKVKASLTITARDGAGNVTTEKRAVRLER